MGNRSTNVRSLRGFSTTPFAVVMDKSVLFPILICTSLSAACGGGGGGGGGGAIQGLEAPGQLSVVCPVEGGGAPETVAPAASTDGFPLDADYFTDDAERWVYDPAIDALELVNEILCSMRQTGAQHLVNEGPYNAQVDPEVCGRGEDRSAVTSETGQSTSADAEEIDIWCVDSRRASNGLPQTVDVWVPLQDDFLGALTIFGRAEIRRGVDANSPFGDFSLDFAAAVDPLGLSDPAFHGTLGTSDAQQGNVGFSFYQEVGDLGQIPAPGEFSEVVQVAVELESGSADGFARVFRTVRFDDGGGDSGQIPEEYLIAFDGTHFLRSRNGGSGQAFRRDDFRENVWRYGLYEASGPEAGSRVERESGFGFRTLSGEYGWIGYYGMWVPDGVDVLDSDMVIRDVFDDPPGEEVFYTVVRAPGKLLRYTRNELDLGELEGYVFEWYEFDDLAQETFVHQVQYDPNTTLWTKSATFDPATGQFVTLAPPEVVDTAALGYLGLYSSSLGGPAAYVHGETFITYYEQEFVDGSDEVFAGGATELELFGLVGCLASGITGAAAEAGDVFLADAPDVATPYRYLFSRSDLTLRHDATGTGAPLDLVGLGAGEMPASGPYTWGMQSGPLVSSTAGLTEVWDVWTAPEFYVYETGHNDWNQFASLIDATGEFVDFEAPLRFTYRHVTANDRNDDAAFDGNTYYLQYNGFGDLQGLPQVGVDLDGDATDDRFYPVLSLKDATLVGPTGTEYVVKALEVEQTLQEDPAYAGGLSLIDASDLVLPNSGDYVEPDIGARPQVDEPPRVIDGQVVGADEPDDEPPLP